MSPFLRAALPVLGTFAAAVVGGIGSVRSGEFYQQLDKPAWAPPGAVFGPVWTVLYVLMAIAAVLVVRRAGWPGARPAMILFGTQLALNALWPWLFFVWRRGAASLLEIAILWVVLVLTILSFAGVHRTAAALLLPYLAWVTFAAALTWAVWRRNPQLLGSAAPPVPAAEIRPASMTTASTEGRAMKPLPASDTALVIRTSYADQAVWEALRGEIERPVGEFRAYVTFVEDPAYDGLDKRELLALLDDGTYRSYVIVADRTTLEHAEHPLLILELGDRPGREFRAVPRELWGVENNLSLANMDFEEFLEALDADGVFRGFRQADG